MNSFLLIFDIAAAALGLGILLLDLWTPLARKKDLGYVAAFGLALILVGTFIFAPAGNQTALGGTYALDALAMFFKRFFLIAAILVTLTAVEFAPRIQAGIAEFYAIILFALTGMMLAASANDFVLVYVSLELITVSFYVLTSFQRARIESLEAGVKYLILGALSSAFMVYGIALIFGTANTTNFNEILANTQAASAKPLFLVGLLLVLVGLGFKIAAFPFQIWAPDVYQGSPAPATAFLAVGSKAAGIVILLRVLFSAVPSITVQWTHLLIGIAAVTILYGNLCAIPQRNLKRLLGYSSISNAGYLLLGFAASNQDGWSAILFYLGGYLFSVIAAFAVIAIVTREAESEDISVVSGLHERSPFLAATLALAMISLAGIPPLAGFFGKFLLLRAALERAAAEPLYRVLVGITIVGVVISFYYYLGVVRAIYWGKSNDQSPIEVSAPMRASLYFCQAALLVIGLFPGPLVTLSAEAVKVLKS
jgi:NADH-quinone oxidoreductase subunit N